MAKHGDNLLALSASAVNTNGLMANSEGNMERRERNVKITRRPCEETTDARDDVWAREEDLALSRKTVQYALLVTKLFVSSYVAVSILHPHTLQEMVREVSISGQIRVPVNYHGKRLGGKIGVQRAVVGVSVRIYDDDAGLKIRTGRHSTDETSSRVLPVVIDRRFV